MSVAPLLAAQQRSDLEVLVALAGLLGRVERSRAPLAADQYQLLVQRLQQALQADIPAAALQAVLAASPALAELYENQHYERAGLCRTPLAAGVAAEQAMRRALARAMRRTD